MKVISRVTTIKGIKSICQPSIVLAIITVPFFLAIPAPVQAQTTTVVLDTPSETDARHGDKPSISAQGYIVTVKSALIAGRKADGLGWDIGGHLPDPYVIVKVLDRDGNSLGEAATTPFSNTYRPEWDECTLIVAKGDWIAFEVYDMDYMLDDLIGKITIRVTEEMILRREINLAFGQVKRLLVGFESTSQIPPHAVASPEPRFVPRGQVTLDAAPILVETPRPATFEFPHDASVIRQKIMGSIEVGSEQSLIFKGRLRVREDQRTTYRLQTPVAVTGARGTDYEVEVPDGDTMHAIAIVHEGEIFVHSYVSGETVFVAAGERLELDSSGFFHLDTLPLDRPPPAPMALAVDLRDTSARGVKELERVVIEKSASTMEVLLDWPHVPTADSYAIMVMDESEDRWRPVHFTVDREVVLIIARDMITRIGVVSLNPYGSSRIEEMYFVFPLDVER